MTKLGTNMYAAAKSADTITSNTPASSRPAVAAESIVPDPAAKAQLDLLSHLIGGSGSSGQQSNFRLNLFSTDEEEE